MLKSLLWSDSILFPRRVVGTVWASRCRRRDRGGGRVSPACAVDRPTAETEPKITGGDDEIHGAKQRCHGQWFEAGWPQRHNACRAETGHEVVCDRAGPGWQLPRPAMTYRPRNAAENRTDMARDGQSPIRLSLGEQRHLPDGAGWPAVSAMIAAKSVVRNDEIAPKRML